MPDVSQFLPGQSTIAPGDTVQAYGAPAPSNGAVQPKLLLASLFVPAAAAGQPSGVAQLDASGHLVVPQVPIATTAAVGGASFPAGGGLTISNLGAVTVTFGTVENTAAQGNDPRIVGAEQTANKGQPDGYAALDPNGHLASAQFTGALVTGALGYTPVQTVAGRGGNVVLSLADIGGTGALAALGVGTGLTPSGGNANVAYGTTAGTAAAGNDSRITGAEQTANKGQPSGYAGLNGSGALASGSYLANVPASSALATPSFSGASARTLEAWISDAVNFNSYSPARDGVTDDSAKFVAACAAAMAFTGKLYIPAGGPVLLTDAAQQTLTDLTIVGDGIVDYGNPLTGVDGYIGSPIWISGTTKSPFLCGRSVAFEGINFYWPGQTEAAAGANGGVPIAYPALITRVPSPSGAQVTRFAMRHCVVINCYDFLTDIGTDAGAASGGNHIVDCFIYAVRGYFTVQNVPEISFLSNCLFSWAAWNCDTLGGATTRYVNTWTNNNGWFLKAVGNGTPTTPATTLVQGFDISNCYLLGSSICLWAAAGFFDLCTFTNFGIDGVPQAIRVDPGGTINNLRWIGGKWYCSRNPTPGVPDVSVISITNPSPLNGALLNFSIDKVEIASCDGSFCVINDADGNVGLVSFDDIRVPYAGGTPGGTGPYYGISIDAANATLKVTGSYLALAGANSGSIGMQVECASVVLIGNTLAGWQAPFDFVSAAAGVFVGNTTTGTTGTASVAGLLSNLFCDANDLDVGAYVVGPLRLRPVASSVNGIGAYGGDAGYAPYFAAEGSDTNIGIGYLTKGSGFHSFKTVSGEALRITDAGATLTAGWQLSGGVAGSPAQMIAEPETGGIAAPATISGLNGGATTIGQSGTLGSPADVPGAFVGGYTTLYPTAGSTVQIPPNVTNVWISAPSGSFTIEMPANPVDGQDIEIATVNPIATFTLSVPEGQGEFDAPTSMGAGSSIRYKFCTPNWLRRGNGG